MWYITLDEIQEKEYMQLIHSKFFYSLKTLFQKIKDIITLFIQFLVCSNLKVEIIQLFFFY